MIMFGIKYNFLLYKQCDKVVVIDIVKNFFIKSIWVEFYFDLNF